MNAPVFFSPRVINTINSLPECDRRAIASAIAGEFICGCSASDDLTPLQTMVMTIIRQYVEHDTHSLSQHIS